MVTVIKHIYNMKAVNKTTSASFDTIMDTYIKSTQQEQSRLQANREDEAQDGWGNERPDAMRLRQNYDYG